MKIVSFSQRNFPEYTIEFTDALSHHGTVFLLLPDEQIAKFREIIDPEVTVCPMKYPREPRFRTYLANLVLLVKYISRIRPDVVHIQGPGKIHIPLFILKKFYGFCLVTTFHDLQRHPGQEQWDFDLLVRLALSCSDHSFVHGERLRESAIAECGGDPEKVTAIPHGSSYVRTFLKYSDPSVTEVENSLLLFGKIARYKCPECLISAAEQLFDRVPGLSVVIAGSGDYWRTCCSRVEGDSHYTVINRFIPHEEAARLFQATSIVVLPYIEASQSAVLHTAWGFAKPVIATDVGSIGEQIQDGFNGFIVPPHDTGALAEAISRLLSDKALRKTLGENGYRTIMSDLAWENFIGRVIGIYEHC
jgi:starch synthase